MNLIANTGIQYFTVPLKIDLNNNSGMFFYEYSDLENKRTLEIAHKFPEDIWAKKYPLYDLGYLSADGSGRVGILEDDGKFKAYTWEGIKANLDNNIINAIKIDYDETHCFSIKLKNCRYEKLENRWLPLPFFQVKRNGESDFGPINWCRFKLIPDASTVEDDTSVKMYNLLLAFDTRTLYEEEGYEEEDLQEKPVFINEESKDFALCDDEFSLLNFCTKHIYEDSEGLPVEIDCDWVNEILLKYFYNCTKEDFENKRDLRQSNDHKMSYMAQYIFIIRYIQQQKILPKITLFADKKINSQQECVNVDFSVVDLVVDMGNSRTCAVLFDSSSENELTDVMPLGLQNFSNPIADRKVAELNGKNISLQEIVKNGKIKNGEMANYQQLKLNRNYDSFDMRLVFREVDFGGSLKRGSSQFTYPSMIRLGTEANDLMHKTQNQETNIEKITTFSSPKRFLWDNKPQQKEWEFITLPGELSSKKPVRIKGVSEQLKSDGSLNLAGDIRGIDKFYSRKALMTFAFLEILAQAKMQINSYEYRHNWGQESKPRHIGRIIVTAPPAMSQKEQEALRQSAEDAAIILNRFYSGNYNEKLDEQRVRKSIKVIPSVASFKNIEERQEWIYDEATCAQFVYLYAQITKRYRNNCKEYFDFYGKVRNDLGKYSKKSLTIGSVDIGAGTTDLMIAAYKYDDAGQCKLTPMPLFWESFYTAGDDLLKELIRELVISGQNAAIRKRLEGANDIAEKILGFFAPNNALQDITRRQIRSEFNLQVSVPVVLRYLELLSEDKNEMLHLAFNDVFINNKPTERVLEHFRNHFGFAVEDLQWNYNKNIVSRIVERTFDTLIGKISTIMSYYGCDIVLLSGRPTSLKPLTDLFVKYNAVEPSSRLITLNSYKVGTWYPFHDGKGFFKDAKSIVAVGAMIGNYASTRVSLGGFSLDFSELITKMLPTTEYFASAENEDAFITPTLNNVTKSTTQLPLRIWTRQLDSLFYPTRPFYMLDFDRDKIKERMHSENEVNDEIERLRRLSPYKFSIVRENYPEDKETLRIESVEDRNGEDISPANFLLQVQSMSESENYWLDSGEFENLTINRNTREI